MLPSRLGRVVLSLGIALVVCPRPARTAPTSHPETPAARAAAIPDLPAADVLRLTDEARQIHETKIDAEGAPPRLLLAHPAAVAADSAHDYDALHYRLDVTPSRTTFLISGTMTLLLKVVDPALANVDLHGASLNVTAARVNGVARTFSDVGEFLRVPVCEGTDCPPHAPGDSLEVAIDYSATNANLGFYRYARNSYTMAEPYDARFWWPCYDLPFDKATLDLYATVPNPDVCVSNGVLVSVTPGAPGTSVYHWQESHPISTYLVALTVGTYWQWTQMAGALPILQNVFPEDSTKMKFDCANMPAMFPVFEARWGPYAFDKYGQVAVTPFGAGGMEHQSLTTINRTWVTGTRSQEDGMAHELAHQWWGDMVTLVDFRNIWLNEGFASYGEAVWRDGFYGAADYAVYVQNQMASALNSDNNLRYALYDPPEANLFGNTIYKKGSVVLHMLRRVLGDGPFFAGMQLYGQRFRYGNASTADFETAMEDASGQTLDWFFQQWVYDKGLPTYNWGWQTMSPTDPDQTSLGVQIRQVQTNAPLFRMPVELQVVRSGRPDTTVVIENDAVALQNWIVPINGVVTGVLFDPRNSIYKRIQQITVDAPPAIPDAGPSVTFSAEPNPSRTSTRLRVALSASTTEPIVMTIYDSAGRAIRSLEPARPGAVTADFVWDLRDRDGRRVASGIYFARARAGANHEDRSLVVLE